MKTIKQTVILFALALLLTTSCDNPTRSNPGNNTTNDGIAGSSGAGGASPALEVPPADAPAPPCEVPAELLDDSGALLCPGSTSYYSGDSGYVEECRASDHEVLIGHDIDPLERQLVHRGESLPPSRWVSDGLAWLCGDGEEAEEVIVILDLFRGCTLRCWVGGDDADLWCDPC